MTNERGWEAEELRDTLVPLISLRHDIYRHTLIKPTAMMLPLSVAPGCEGPIFGLPIVRGDRVALIFEPPKVSGNGV